MANIISTQYGMYVDLHDRVKIVEVAPEAHSDIFHIDLAHTFYVLSGDLVFKNFQEEPYESGNFVEQTSIILLEGQSTVESYSHISFGADVAGATFVVVTEDCDGICLPILKKSEE